MGSPQQDDQFLNVIEQHKGIIFKIARSFQKDEDDQKDLVQEIIFQLWRAYPGFDNRAKLSTWLYKVALNVGISSYRKDKRKNNVVVPMSEAILETPVELEDDSKNIKLKLLQQFINELKELDRALILLYLDEKSGKEMAEILGLSEANIRTKTNRIKEQLKQRFLTIDN